MTFIEYFSIQFDNWYTSRSYYRCIMLCTVKICEDMKMMPDLV